MKRRNLRLRELAQKSPALSEDWSASCRLRPVWSQESGASIHPAGLSTASTERSSYRTGMTMAPSSSSMFFGLATKAG